jgi:tripartite-type tricarboxylate transporter receptor subunit TctC
LELHPIANALQLRLGSAIHAALRIGDRFRMAPLPSRRILVAALLAAPAIARTPHARAADWPTQPIRLIVASAPGGNADVVARLVAAELEGPLGQRINVQNLPAASGMRATEAAVRAEPDGHTWLVGTSSQLVHNLALFDPFPFDLVGGLRGVALLNDGPMTLLVRAEDPARTLAEWVADARARPGAKELGSGPPGTTTHVSGLLFAEAAGIQLVHVPYNAGSLALADMLAGRIAAHADISVTAVPQVAQGRARALAVASRARLEALPDVPTMHEAGVMNFHAGTWNSIAVPAQTPDAIVGRINAMVAAVVQAPAMRARLAQMGAAVLPPKSPAEVDAFYAAERAVWIPAVRATGIRAQQ